MTEQELQARAIQRAHDQHVYIRRTARAGVYVTNSRSEPGVKYTLVAGAGITACSCKGYLYRQSCKHVEALRNRLAREQQQARRAAVCTMEAA
jgi:uncharacterized membrane protein